MALILLGAACRPAGTPQNQAAAVTREQFRQLEWITGTWRGSGGEYPAFFEQYELINDSTLRMRSFADSTLASATDSSIIAWRDGIVESRSPRSTYAARAFTPTSVSFIKRGVAGGGFTFTRVSSDEWTATLHPAEPGREPVVYTMRRMGP
ncbi:MAG TPA: hypothetical protein VFK36_08205 [Gemmatimonadales bacterium]|nr:hypothetical protein [Gemmatimonadales bacterium]